MTEYNLQEWLSKADEDETAGKDILKAGHTYSLACFHFQQSAEKLLISLLIFYSRRFSNTHDLMEMRTQLLAIAPEVQNLEPELEALSPYYHEARYPGRPEKFTHQEAEKALSAMLKVKKFVRGKIKLNS
jgi:HEPN domain-containing protein